MEVSYLFRNCLLSLVFFICRIESIGSLEIQGRSSTLQGKQITLVDNDGVKLKFLLWGEQVILANLCRLALAQDFVGIALSQNMFITDFFFQCWKHACIG